MSSKTSHSLMCTESLINKQIYYPGKVSNCTLELSCLRSMLEEIYSIQGFINFSDFQHQVFFDPWLSSSFLFSSQLQFFCLVSRSDLIYQFLVSFKLLSDVLYFSPIVFIHPSHLVLVDVLNNCICYIVVFVALVQLQQLSNQISCCRTNLCKYI